MFLATLFCKVSWLTFKLFIFLLLPPFIYIIIYVDDVFLSFIPFPIFYTIIVVVVVFQYYFVYLALISSLALFLANYYCQLLFRCQSAYSHCHCCCYYSSPPHKMPLYIFFAFMLLLLFLYFYYYFVCNKNKTNWILFHFIVNCRT